MKLAHRNTNIIIQNLLSKAGSPFLVQNLFPGLDEVVPYGIQITRAADLICSSVKGISRKRIPTASKIAFAIAAGVGP